MSSAAGSSSTSPGAGYPAARRDELVEELHGRRVADPYRWLEYPDSDETLKWVAAQEELIATTSSEWKTRPDFAARIAELLATGDIGIPRLRGHRIFFTRRATDGEHPVLYVGTVSDPASVATDERAVVDPLAIDPAGTTTLQTWSPSPSSALIAVQLSVGGTEDSDPVVFGEEHDKASIFTAETDPTGRWLLVHSQVGTEHRNDVWLADLAATSADEPSFVPVITGAPAETGGTSPTMAGSIC